LIFGVLVLQPLFFFLSFYHAYPLATHTQHSFSFSFISSCHTLPSSLFLPYLSSTHTHIPVFPFFSCLSYHTLT
jgi:hypothetical protein